MSPREQLIREIEQVPDTLVGEILDFLAALRDRPTQDSRQSNETPSSDRTQKPIWELFEEAAENLPEEVVAKLPVDGADQIDHYLYGTPKH
ncbi:MAG TPA: hypothetical protein V6C57_14230 [Coleofasciculaceae cyanobacterium]